MRKKLDTGLSPETEVEVRMYKTTTLKEAKRILNEAPKKGWYAKIFRNGQRTDLKEITPHSRIHNKTKIRRTNKNSKTRT